MEDLSQLFRAIDLMGVVLNGFLGGAIARRNRFDIVGFGILAIVSALGGGALRDMLLNTLPVALTDPAYLLCALIGAVLAYLIVPQGRVWRGITGLADGMVLGAWATTGTTKALAAGLDWLPSMLLGLTTAVGGGMIRDVAVGNVPAVFGGNNLYATPALVASGGVLIANGLGMPADWLMLLGVGLGLSITGASRLWRIRLPRHDDQDLLRLSPSQLKALVRRAERIGRKQARQDTSDEDSQRQH